MIILLAIHNYRNIKVDCLKLSSLLTILSNHNYEFLYYMLIFEISSSPWWLHKFILCSERAVKVNWVWQKGPFMAENSLICILISYMEIH